MQLPGAPVLVTATVTPDEHAEPHGRRTPVLAFDGLLRR